MFRQNTHSSNTSSEHSSDSISRHHNAIILEHNHVNNDGDERTAPEGRGMLQRSNSSSSRFISTLIGGSNTVSTYPELGCTAQHPPPEVDASCFRPLSGNRQVRSDILWQHFLLRGWLTKHTPPTYSFTTSRKRRYVVLADRMLYVFKSDQPTSHYREFFELTKNTQVFVSDRFAGVVYCIAVSKRDRMDDKNWYLQCEDACTMKVWLDKLKKTVAWLKQNEENSVAAITLTQLANVQSEHDVLVNQAIHKSDPTPVPPSPPPLPISLSPTLSAESQSQTWRRIRGEESERGRQGSTATTISSGSSSSEGLSFTTSLSLTTLSVVPPPRKSSIYEYHAITTDIAENNDRLADEHRSRILSVAHPSILPPQRPPPRRAPPPPPSPQHQYRYTHS